MNCPKCGHDNPEGTIFCEECDWKLNQKYKQKMDVGKKVVITAYIAIVLGVASVITSALKFGIFGAVCGGIGMVVSSYCQTIVRMNDEFTQKYKSIFIITMTVTLVCSVVGFIYGLYITIKG